VMSLYLSKPCFAAICQVQVKHWACPRSRNGVSCVCGVAMRENETILVADMCANETAIIGKVPNYITYYGKHLPDDAGIKVSDAGDSFKVSNVQFRRPSSYYRNCKNECAVIYVLYFFLRKCIFPYFAFIFGNYSGSLLSTIMGRNGDERHRVVSGNTARYADDQNMARHVGWLVEQGFTSHSTQFKSFRRR